MRVQTSTRSSTHVRNLISSSCLPRSFWKETVQWTSSLPRLWRDTGGESNGGLTQENLSVGKTDGTQWIQHYLRVKENWPQVISHLPVMGRTLFRSEKHETKPSVDTRDTRKSKRRWRTTVEWSHQSRRTRAVRSGRRRTSGRWKMVVENRE